MQWLLSTPINIKRWQGFPASVLKLTVAKLMRLRKKIIGFNQQNFWL